MGWVPARSSLSRWAVTVLLGAALGPFLGLLVGPVGALTPERAESSGPASSQTTPELAAPASAIQIPPVGGPARTACAGVLAGMSTRAKLAQRLMVGVGGGDPVGTARLVRDTQVGGIFVGGTATALLRGRAMDRVQAATRVPLAVAVDDEGGRVQRIDALAGNLPSAREMGRLDLGRVEQLGLDRGRALRAVGITVNFAPAVDVSAQPDRAVIGDRSFGDDPTQVARAAAAFASGERSAGVFTVLKHFPGHGHAIGDSHRGQAVTPSLAALRADDLRPYAELLGPGGPLAGARTGVMVGHLSVPGLTDGLPASLTPATYRLLRDEIGFRGVVYTDDLSGMKAVTSEFDLPAATERALSAGADVALSTGAGQVSSVLDRLTAALAAGRLDRAANDAAVTRILTAKAVCS